MGQEHSSSAASGQGMRLAWRGAVARTWPALALTLVIALYAGLQAAQFIPGCPETDTAAYLTLAERILHGQPVARLDDDPFLYQAHCWLENPRGEIVPKYSPGYPILLAVGLFLGGRDGAYLVNPLLGALTVAGVYLLFRCWMGRCAALLGALALATLPLFLSFTRYPLAHAADLCGVVWGMYFLWRWVDRPGWGMALAAGLTLGYAQLIRPQDAVLCLPVVAAAAMAAGERRWAGTAWVDAAVLLGSYAIFPVVHLIYNALVYGGPFTTGYGLSGEQTAFTFSDLLRNAPYAFDLLCGPGLSVYFGLGLVGLLTIPRRRDAILAAAWVLPLLLLCLSYYWAPHANPPGYLRLFLPVFPALIGQSFALIGRLPLGPRQAVLVMALLGGIVLAAHLPMIIRHTGSFQRPTLLAQYSAETLALERLPGNATIFAEPPAAFHLGDRFRLYDLQAFRPGRIAELFSGGEAAVRYQPSREERIREFYARNGTRLPELLREKVAAAVAGRGPCVFLIRKSQQAYWRNTLGPDVVWLLLGESPAADRQAWSLWEIRVAAAASSPETPWAAWRAYRLFRRHPGLEISHGNWICPKPGIRGAVASAG